MTVGIQFVVVGCPGDFTPARAVHVLGECLHCARLCDLEALVGVCVCAEAHSGSSLARRRCQRFASTEPRQSVNSLADGFPCDVDQ